MDTIIHQTVRSNITKFPNIFANLNIIFNLDHVTVSMSLSIDEHIAAKQDIKHAKIRMDLARIETKYVPKVTAHLNGQTPID